MGRKRNRIKAWLYEDPMTKSEIGGYIPLAFMSSRNTRGGVKRYIIGKKHPRYKPFKGHRYIIFKHDTEIGSTKGVDKIAKTKGFKRAIKIVNQLLIGDNSDGGFS